MINFLKNAFTTETPQDLSRLKLNILAALMAVVCASVVGYLYGLL